MRLTNVLNRRNAATGEAGSRATRSRNGKSRAVAGVAFGLAAVVALSGCGGGTGAGAGKDKTLDVWIRASADSQATYQMIFDKYKEKTGVDVKVFATLTDFETKLNAAAAAKNLPDVAIDDAAQLGNFAKAGIIQPVEKDNIAGHENITDAAWKSTQTIDGKYQAVPFSAQANVLLVRSDWLKKVGMTAPTTWDEMIKVAKAFTNDDPDGNGKADTFGLAVPGSTSRGYISWNWSTYLWQNGGDYITGSGTDAKPAINSASAVDAAKWYQNLFCTDKVVQPGALNAKTTESNKAWQTGVAGMYLTGPYAFATTDAAGLEGKYEVVAPPAGPANDSVLAEGTSIYMMSGSKKADLAKQLAEFMITPESQTLGMVGNAKFSIVRLPVNSTVDAATTYNDPRWKLTQDVYKKSAVYEPVQLPAWQEMRQATSDTLNGLMASCADPKPAMDELNAKFSSLLNAK